MIPGNYGLLLDLPPGWVDLPEPRGDLPVWAYEEAARLWSSAPGDPGPGAMDATARHLLAVATDSISRQPSLAAALLPDPGGPMAVLLEVVPLEPDPGAPFTVEGFAAQLGKPHKDLVKAAETELVADLPLGPAVRVRRLWRGKRGRWGRRDLQEELTYMILPTVLTDEGLVVTASWSDLTLAEPFAAEVEVLVRALQVVEPR